MGHQFEHAQRMDTGMEPIQDAAAKPVSSYQRLNDIIKFILHLYIMHSRKQFGTDNNTIDSIGGICHLDHFHSQLFNCSISLSQR